MKKVFVVSKTHLDLGFTDYAENIRRKYITEFIPDACAAAKALNAEKKRFVWTTGSWILKEALSDADETRRNTLVEALKRGDIAPHALPFTTHSELLDEDTFDYGLSIADQIDKISGRKTTAAKMTDVPGHTIGIVPLLAKHGIKLLHIGVNGASAMPEVPECFLWKNGDSEVIVVYSGAYGGAYNCEYTGDILYFDHTQDNGGTKKINKISEKIAELEKQYPDYEVAAGRIDDFAERLWEAREKLPVVTSEIGDTWIHGSAADPYKSAAVRTLIACKNRWLADGTLLKGSDEYNGLCDNILCLCEHTCGMDVKRWFADYENYLKADFQKARAADAVKLRHPFRDFPQNALTLFERARGEYSRGSYGVIEKSWAEQRLYIDKAVSHLSKAHTAEIFEALSALRPSALPELSGEKLKLGEPYSIGNKIIIINKFGGLGFLSENGRVIISENEKAPVSYRSYGVKDYDYWLKNYTRDIKKTFTWAVGDFARPLLKYADKSFPQGEFGCFFTAGTISGNKIKTVLTFPDECTEKLGAPRKVCMVYTIEDDKVTAELYWMSKDASRLTESISFNLMLNTDKEHLKYKKTGSFVNPYNTIKNGGRKLSAAESVVFGADGFTLKSFQAPLAALGKTDILHFDNKQPDVEKDGLSFVLYDNVWGTNFPLWYEENAYFKFEISHSE